ncbi:Dihydroxyacetone kinase family protein [Pseudonocardia sp. Ae168_Ps1]|uniref:DAK2 domain-containing protein n=1 Tax=unclassified Pseudonocardia TaxID=2619320 RepID=UPI00094B13C5|nr:MULTISPECIES: DAK2 domain-containing protein [unclassified Pseudonocardia]OLL76391.1 Dihydroxyacetone kinase family protein [Pseudonocardia sp. Ae150A_Ps1]OLL82401.1 Dihydroxyacetone kinase family protein [Pseudonocardia sp. Ae168_Ps1]OLL83484.1 Dihydroxyacetone kinase family protein [Pseudonocardia sp. Ae263_Ps1]OLL90477.1 Dihydroxyacetone kinase family protein [Pseudonocardia sp. Ae356_Ps1]
MAPPFDPALLRRWIDAAAARLAECRAEIDRINVFPVADHDTGSNLLLTVRAAASAPLEGGPARAAAALAAAAVRGARGNSGLILSQLFRGVAEELDAGEGRGGANGDTRGDGAVVAAGSVPGAAPRPRSASAAGVPDAVTVLAGALRCAADLAAAAVSVPRPGTALTVLDAAASALAARVPVVRTGSDPVRGERTRANHGNEGVGAIGGRVVAGGLAGGARLAAEAARVALTTPVGRPAELVRAGVVDAGGLGLVAVLDALVLATGGEPAPPPPGTAPGGPVAGAGSPPSRADTPPNGNAGAPDGAAPAPADAPHRRAVPPDRADGMQPARPVPQPVYEVTYWLADPGADALATLRARLSGLGDSVTVAGDGTGGCTVHVHTTEAGPAVEAGTVAGRPSSIRIEALPAEAPTRARAVLLMIESAGAGALARQAGGDVLVAEPDPAVDEVLAAIRATGAEHVAVLPCAAHRRTLAETAAARVREEGIDVVVVPSSSVLQGLAALAVHDPARRASDDVVAMAEAAAGTRTGGLQIAEAEALTWAGPCRPGEVLGLSDGEVVLIAPDLAVGALWLAHRMLTPGGELVTVLLGSAAGDGLGERFADDLRRTHPEVDVVVHRGGQSDFPLVLGVE